MTFVLANPDYENGRLVYDVEFYTADYKEYDYEIDAASGEILSKDFDAEYYNAQSGQSSSGETIGEAEAEEIALAKVPGATDVLKMKLERDDGRLKYEGTIIYNEMEYDFDIDAYSGTILEWSAESIYD